MDTEPCGFVLRTHLGWAAAAVRGGRIVAVALPHASREEALTALGPGVNVRVRSELLARLEQDFARYFAGERVQFDDYSVDVDEQPPFVNRALRAARRIRYGETRTYAWVAKEAGSALAARAAGQAMARNRIPLIIPCHRVVAAGGGLGGFGGGLELKRALLELEGRPFP
jgi:methylated-DNA-[protein]-cysteine S-methyltransferase